MKLFQKTWFAWLLTAVMIAAAVGIGQVKGGQHESAPLPSGSAALDESLSVEGYTDYILDETGTLSSKQERQISLYNANWALRYDSIIAVAVKESVSGNLDDYAYDLGMDIGLSGTDAILVIDASAKDAYLAASPDYPLTDSQIETYTNSALKPYVESGKYGEGVINLFLELNQFYVNSYGLGYLDNSGGYAPFSGGDTIAGVVMLAFILIAIVFIINAIDQSRYNTYRQRYYGVVNPPVVFRPIFFWHGPGTSWYRRHWRQPPPPPPPRPPRGPGGPGSGSGGGFSGFSGPGGGGFSGSGSSRGGGFTGGRGGGFGGGGFSGGGISRGGGFSGGRGGGFSGGSRGGGFGRR